MFLKNIEETSPEGRKIIIDIINKEIYYNDEISISFKSWIGNCWEGALVGKINVDDIWNKYAK
jgi:hypothetical protein